MKLAISNLASDSVKDIANTGVGLLECVFSKIGNIKDIDHNTVREWAAKLPSTITPYSTQSITYNCGLAEFNYDNQTLLIIDRVINIAKILQLKRVVFGSPTIRIGEPDIDLFAYIDNQLQDTDILFCIEPNASSYGGDYFFNIEEVVKFISKNNFKNICSMIDTHNTWLEDRDCVSDIHQFREYIKHVHASEVKLQGFTSMKKHHAIATALSNIEYNSVVTYESLNMVGVRDFINVYGNCI